MYNRITLVRKYYLKTSEATIVRIEFTMDIVVSSTDKTYIK